MKKSSKLFAMIAFMVMLLSSCQGDIEMLTIINEDGSCMREIVVDADRSLLTTGKYDNDDPHVARIEDGWELYWGYKGDNSRFPIPMSVEKYDSISKEVGPSRAVKDTVCVYARKEYASVEDMCAGSPMFFVDEQAGADGSLDKEFRWFYTDYVFTEKFSSVADYFKVPVTDFMSEEEALYWFSGTPDLYAGKPTWRYYEMLEELKEKADRWALANIYYNILSGIADRYDMVVEPPVSKDEFIAQLRDVVKQIASYDTYKLEYSTARSIVSSHFGSDAYSPFINEDEWKKDEKLSATAFDYLFLFYYNESIVMPGRVIDDGGGIYKDGVVAFKVDAGRFLLKDYEIRVVSRVVNVWAFIVTAVLASALCAAVIYRRR
ncbi:MAG: hypothetical protein J6K83_01220 [Bacteroidaceae bacterium]|nr:hypothetical protein [Bacteroidaceae bacterium]MBP3407747.1 hypothetical protein [Bacteroidaceae bacterium]